MADESRKTNLLRGDAFIRKYLSGRVIDIGAGRDLVCPNAEGFDIADGDANVITSHRVTNNVVSGVLFFCDRSNVWIASCPSA